MIKHTGKIRSFSGSLGIRNNSQIQNSKFILQLHFLERLKIDTILFSYFNFFYTREHFHTLLRRRASNFRTAVVGKTVNRPISTAECDVRKIKHRDSYRKPTAQE